MPGSGEKSWVGTFIAEERRSQIVRDAELVSKRHKQNSK